MKTQTQRNRAIMVIHHTQHTVVNMENNERFTLPPLEAWAMYERLNKKEALQ